MFSRNFESSPIFTRRLPRKKLFIFQIFKITNNEIKVCLDFFWKTLTAQNRRYHWRIFYLCISRFREKSSEGQDKAALHASPILDRSSIQLNLRHDNLKMIISFTRKFRNFVIAELIIMIKNWALKNLFEESFVFD